MSLKTSQCIIELRVCLSKVNLHREATSIYLPLFFSAVEVHCLLEQLSILVCSLWVRVPTCPSVYVLPEKPVTDLSCLDHLSQQRL